MKRRTFFGLSSLFGLGLTLPIKIISPEPKDAITQPKVIEPVNLGEQHCETPEQFVIEVIDYIVTIQPDNSIIISGRGFNEYKVVKYFKTHINNSKFKKRNLSIIKFEECPDIEIDGRYTKLLKIVEKPLYEQNNVDCIVPMSKKHIITLTCKSF